MHATLIRHPDCEGNDNRGFSHDRIELLVDGLPAGYLSIAHIPFHRVLQWHGLDKARAAIEFQAVARGMEPDELLASEERLGLVPRVSPDVLEDAWWDMDGRGNLKDGAGTVDYQVDRPYVDYIRIYEPGDFIRDTLPLRFRSRRSDEKLITRNYRKLGLGILLYVEGARWMAERSMLFHASSNQQPEAIASWAFMRNEFAEAIHDIPKISRGQHDSGIRTLLDGRLLDGWLPHRMKTIEIQERPSGRHPSTLNYGDISEDSAEWSRRKDEGLRAEGIEPMGGEPFPCCPRDALREWENSHASSPSP